MEVEVILVEEKGRKELGRSRVVAVVAAALPLAFISSPGTKPSWGRHDFSDTGSRLPLG
jgi:hypothetical protein